MIHTLVRMYDIGWALVVGGFFATIGFAVIAYDFICFCAEKSAYFLRFRK